MPQRRKKSSPRIGQTVSGRKRFARSQESQSSALAITDLKDFHAIDANALMPKTKFDQFWRLTTTDFFAHLRANTKRLAEQGIRLKESDEDKLRKRFETAQNKILPLESQIAFTDTLIDQVVYRLYGLTEDEVKIVESGGKNV